ncbi:uncharacterized protein LOC111995357 [Quercus suber]|uniref:uncharacterized protein LOC111995357 n=1 Tax=Quercus suber TaxID=58331 RepID=UPI0032DE5384
MLAEEGDDKNERAIYYLSKRFHDYETRYTSIEKSCFALVWVVQKLRHIVLPFQIWVVARMDPLKYLFEKPTLSGRLSRWLILLAELDLKYVARKTIKGSVVSDFCIENPIEGEDGTWKMYFDEAVNQHGNRIGILLITPKGSHIPLAIKLNFETTNNMVEYEKLWKVKEEHLKPCCYHILFALDLRARPRKSKNIIFSPWGHKDIQNDVEQPIRTSKHPDCLFQPK